MYENFKLHAPSFQFKSLIFVEAGVIRGGNYTYVTEWVKKRLETGKKIITLGTRKRWKRRKRRKSNKRKIEEKPSI